MDGIGNCRACRALVDTGMCPACTAAVDRAFGEAKARVDARKEREEIARHGNFGNGRMTP